MFDYDCLAYSSLSVIHAEKVDGKNVSINKFLKTFKIIKLNR